MVEFKSKIYRKKLEIEKMNKKAMLSQPMNGKTDEEIIATREKAIKELEVKGYEVVRKAVENE